LQETRYRQRYLDGIVNHDHVRNIFVTRASIACVALCIVFLLGI